MNEHKRPCEEEPVPKRARLEVNEELQQKRQAAAALQEEIQQLESIIQCKKSLSSNLASQKAVQSKLKTIKEIRELITANEGWFLPFLKQYNIYGGYRLMGTSELYEEIEKGLNRKLMHDQENAVKLQQQLTAFHQM